jgi:hypothetical protein
MDHIQLYVKLYDGSLISYIFIYFLFIYCSRGWIEKFDRGSLFPSLYGNKKSDKRNNKSDDDDDDDDVHELGDDDLGLFIIFN